jgi:hypothetical protein
LSLIRVAGPLLDGFDDATPIDYQLRSAFFCLHEDLELIGRARQTMVNDGIVI